MNAIRRRTISGCGAASRGLTGVRLHAGARLCGLLLAVSMVAACTGGQFKSPSLYQRLGGKGGLVLIVDGWLSRAAADGRLSGWFGPGVADRIRPRMVEQLCELSGGPCQYAGRDMRAVHAGLRVDAMAYDAMLDALARSLAQLKIPAADQKALMQLLAPARAQVLGS